MPDWSLWRVTKNDCVMKPSILDALGANTTSSSERCGEEIRIVKPWESLTLPKKNSTLQEIKGLLSTYKDKALTIIENLYYYNSQVKILKNIIHITDDQIVEIQLLVLPGTKVIIDLFHSSKKELIGEYYKGNYNYDTVEKYFDYILNKIKESEEVGSNDLSSYIFLSRDEALQFIPVLQNVSELKRWENDKKIKIEHPVLIKESRAVSISVLTSRFFGKHNWAIGHCYSEMLKKINYRLLPFQVICYENSSDINVSNKYCIETYTPAVIEDELTIVKSNEEIAVFSNQPVSNSECNLLFHGFYSLDFEESKLKEHIVFKRIKSNFEAGI